MWHLLTIILSVSALIVSVLSALYTKRTAAEAKRANDRLAHRDHEEREARRFAWDIQPTPAGRNVWALVNTGTEIVEDVRAESDAALIAAPVTADRLIPGASIRFATAWSPHAGTGNELMVTWRGHPEPQAVRFPPPSATA